MTVCGQHDRAVCGAEASRLFEHVYGVFQLVSSLSLALGAPSVKLYEVVCLGVYARHAPASEPKNRQHDGAWRVVRSEPGAHGSFRVSKGFCYIPWRWVAYVGQHFSQAGQLSWQSV
jgi:hypothetical protein